MTPGKRAFDLILLMLLTPLLLPVIAVIALLVLVIDGAPVFYLSERMATPTRGFTLVKFRTMTVRDRRDSVTGGDKSAEITRIGGYLRRLRLDELPQLWNILRGDLSFVGPRPPLRRYVEARPDLYARVLACRPGVTGLATLVYHAEETRLLGACESPEATHETYLRRCVPRKGRLDLIYAAHRSICLDLIVLLLTAAAVFLGIRRNPAQTERRR